MKESLSAMSKLIEHSKKARQERGEEFFSSKRPLDVEVTHIRPAAEEKTLSRPEYKTARTKHLALNKLIASADAKLNLINNPRPILDSNLKKRVHVYFSTESLAFINEQVKDQATKWKLRKNAGMGDLIGKFVEKFKMAQEREDKQLSELKKIILEFKKHYVDFKTLSNDPDNYERAELVNQKIMILSKRLITYLQILHFDENSLKESLGNDSLVWMDLIIKWNGI